MYRSTLAGFFLVLAALGPACASAADIDLCNPAPDPAKIVRAIASKAASLEEVKVVPREEYLADSGAVDLVVFKKYVAADKPPDEARTSYQIVVVSADSAIEAATSETPTVPAVHQFVPSALIRAEAATPGAKGTDFTYKEGEPTAGKTLLHFRSNIVREPKAGIWWQAARVFVVGCAGADPKPMFVGSFDTKVSTNWFCAVLAFAAVVVFYAASALGTFFVHASQSKLDSNEDLKAFFSDGVSPKGTNFMGKWRHLDPVVLCAGGDGRGSAGMLQILFFSLIVFGVISFIWMRTGHLSGLSSNVLLLMGISGMGAVAAGGAKLAQSRIDFDNLAWLVHRGWMPRGGVAQLNPARWRDVITSDGTFDVYRFQMLSFSFLVGMTLLAEGVQVNDLSTFEMPTEFLSILGLSQAVYVLGTVIAPPSIHDLNDQIRDVQKKEKALRDAFNQATPSHLVGIHVLLTENDSVKAARNALEDYIEAWNKTLIMYTSTLGKEVPDEVKKRRPPFEVPGPLEDEGRLPPGVVGEEYEVTLVADGGKPPYTWDFANLDDQRLVELRGLKLKAGKLTGTPNACLDQSLSFVVRDSADPAVSKLRKLRLTINNRRAPEKNCRSD